MKPGRMVMLVLGTIAALLGLGLLAGAAGVGWLNFQQRDEGYFTTQSHRFDAASSAITTAGLDVMVSGRLPDVIPSETAGSILLRGAAADPGKGIFIGVAPQQEASRYLEGVKRSEIRELNLRPFRVDYTEVPGTRTPARPGAQNFWAASAEGTGTQELKWNILPGSWTVVVMNADATAPVSVDLQAGVRSDLLWPLFLWLLIGGIVLLVIGVPLIVAGAMGLGRHGPPPYLPPAQDHPGQYHPGRYPPGHPLAGQSPPAETSTAGPPAAAGATGPFASSAVPGGSAGVPPVPPGNAGVPPGTTPVPPAMQPASYPAPGYLAPGYPAPGGGAGTPPPPAVVDLLENPRYPARLTGHVDPALSRWMWLVKWFLAIPHLIVLFFLWFALIVTSIVAWFAILFTARYPHSLFNFNVGVLRWSWRVSFYAFTAIGTDRYPPFTLARTDYPADFEVDYPDHLSRGLVLVKSWLLAIPHLLIVGALAGSTRTWVAASDDDFAGAGRYSAGNAISLLTLLAFIAGVILLFTGRYLRSLFDLLIGLNRWIYRVLAYIALMRDEYPPFRLDMGPADPGEPSAASPQATPPGGPS
ncbi:DUF4389 domain-containing protein [Arthrobacter globiformis]|uniref:DUF4389 domain-containing protein n=1 Tax=Arthrobacter globiformis TaxID=1665 RepID=UPI0027843A6B|nr:DUF4389 domain-containing protein [Arthrobacter globiformis]MDQ0862462.1 hypothetical protein [Arthrobacter globiformis]